LFCRTKTFRLANCKLRIADFMGFSIGAGRGFHAGGGGAHRFHGSEKTIHRKVAKKQRRQGREKTLCGAISENCAFLAKFFSLFVSFVSFCKIHLVAALPRCAFASLRLCAINPCVDWSRQRSPGTTAEPSALAERKGE
jgi:hypothetical protein